MKNCFLNYGWPGNVRELKNVIRRVSLLTDGNEIQVDVLPLELSNYAKDFDREQALKQIKSKSSDKPKDLKNAAQEAEYDTILSVLKEVNFNKTKAAKILNIDRKTLYNKIKVIKIEDQQ
ncbi:helix-turn-helix domain-containing protein [Pedobacter agri]|uniref:helix-turn-helix domain-containing protein n=1 Tax=Pedobacter agri TaxID=454586 RepID=UPI0029301004|nr:helix-turn-helix domain-containing protein [Pedobacter agri]